MNSKNIKKHLKRKMNDWFATIEDKEVKKVLQDNCIVTGGAIVSLLTDDQVNDYDVYLKTREAVKKVAEYYVKVWNNAHPDKAQAQLKVSDDGKVKIFIRSAGIEGEDAYMENELPAGDRPVAENESEEEGNPKYRPVFLTSNAITLSQKVQIVIRFYGDVEEIHKNYDFAHCTCAWSMWDNKLSLPVKALECIINKELYYIGSKYPLCSIIRTRKYLKRGYHINAGQYVKMAMHLNELDLNRIEVLEEQLTGVDTAYFLMMIDSIRDSKQKNGEDLRVDSTYVIELINKLF